jgi:DNA polymerase V
MPPTKLHTGNIIDIYSASTETKLELPLINSGISAGFPSPALDFVDLKIDLNDHLIKHPTATFLGRVKGESLKNAGISDGDLLVIDKSLEAGDGKIAICHIDGEFTAKRIKVADKKVFLMPENEAYKPIEVKECNDFTVWGIVTHVIKDV